MNSSLERSPSRTKSVWNVHWTELDQYIPRLCMNIGDACADKNAIVAVNRGGVIPGMALSHWFDKPLIIIEPFDFNAVELPDNVVVVEDVVDTGKVYNQVCDKLFTTGKQFIFTALFIKPWSPRIDYYVNETEKWVKMPWEYRE